MKRIKQIITGVILLLLTAAATQTRAQSTDMVQLILDIEKLTQLKGILTDMKTGYQMINGGYNQVKSIAQGNFNLHQAFLNGLLAVSPAVAGYCRVADIVLEQGYIVTEYTRTYGQVKQSGRLSADELAYLGNVYTALLQQSLLNLSQLADILTAGKLRMSDDERLQAIDHIYADTDDKLTFLRHFGRQAIILTVQRQNEQNDIHGIQNLY